MVSVRRVFRYIQIDTGLQRSPPAGSEILTKQTRPANDWEPKEDVDQSDWTTWAQSDRAMQICGLS